VPSVANLYLRLKSAKTGNRLVYVFSLMVFFWAVFDGIVSFITPIVITQHGISKTMMGVIIASSSVAGAIIDFLLSKVLENTHYRRLWLATFAICGFYPLILGTASSVPIFVLAMALWGFYYDLQNFGTFDFVSRKSKPEEHSSSFGVISIFKSLGYLIAPIIAGLTIVEVVTALPFALAFVFLAIAFLFFLVLSAVGEKGKSELPEKIAYKKVNVLVELHLWSKIGFILLPVLAFTLMLYIFDAFFWTVGPLYSSEFADFKDFGGLFMTTYTLPMLVTGWFVGPITRKFGKKKTAFWSFLACSLILSTLFYWKSPIIVLLVALLSSMIGSIAWPAVKGCFVDYITESYKYEKEIEGLQDFFTNIGYVIGPILAGVLSDRFGNGPTFSLLGIVGVVVSIILLLKTPREIKVKV